MTTAKDLTDQLINRAKNLKEFIVERDFDDIPSTVLLNLIFNIQKVNLQESLYQH